MLASEAAAISLIAGMSTVEVYWSPEYEHNFEALNQLRYRPRCNSFTDAPTQLLIIHSILDILLHIRLGRKKTDLFKRSLCEGVKKNLDADWIQGTPTSSAK